MVVQTRSMTGKLLKRLQRKSKSSSPPKVSPSAKSSKSKPRIGKPDTSEKPKKGKSRSNFDSERKRTRGRPPKDSRIAPSSTQSDHLHMPLLQKVQPLHEYAAAEKAPLLLPQVSRRRESSADHFERVVSGSGRSRSSLWGGAYANSKNSSKGLSGIHGLKPATAVTLKEGQPQSSQGISKAYRSLLTENELKVKGVARENQEIPGPPPSSPVHWTTTFLAVCPRAVARELEFLGEEEELQLEKGDSVQLDSLQEITEKDFTEDFQQIGARASETCAGASTSKSSGQNSHPMGHSGLGASMGGVLVKLENEDGIRIWNVRTVPAEAAADAAADVATNAVPETNTTNETIRDSDQPPFGQMQAQSQAVIGGNQTVDSEADVIIEDGDEEDEISVLPAPPVTTPAPQPRNELPGTSSQARSSSKSIPTGPMRSRASDRQGQSDRRKSVPRGRSETRRAHSNSQRRRPYVSPSSSDSSDDSGYERAPFPKLRCVFHGVTKMMKDLGGWTSATAKSKDALKKFCHSALDDLANEIFGPTNPVHGAPPVVKPEESDPPT